MAKLLRETTYRARQLRRTQTPAEQVLWQALRARKLAHAKFRRQQPLGPYIVDFFCEEHALVVELDGASHFPRPQRDLVRDRFLSAAGLLVLRFENCEVFDGIERVLAKIQSCFAPSPFGRGLG